MYQWRESRGKKIVYQKYYHEYLIGRRRLEDISKILGISVRTIQKKFDKIEVSDWLLHPAPKHGINLIIDATFFGREYGYLCFHDGSRMIWFKEIIDENNADLRAGLITIKQAGYRFKSVTIDGRKGYYPTIRVVLGGVPIQMCLFHMKMIINRYLSGQKNHDSAKELSDLVDGIVHADVQEFIIKFYFLKQKHKEFISQKTKGGSWKNLDIRKAYASMHYHMSMCFTFREFPEQNIPHTTNHIEGAFSHIKERLRMHRGLILKRKKQAIKFLISQAK